MTAGTAPDLLDDLREGSGVLGCGYPLLPGAVPGAVPEAAREEPVEPGDPREVLAAALEGYEDYGS